MLIQHCIFVVPGNVICITPPQLHINLESLVSAGLPPIKSVGLPGTQGETVTGMHGIGVSTPIAAAVADATIGLAILLHIPKGVIFIMGT